MNLQPDVIAELRALLEPVRDFDQRIDALVEPVAAAKAAVSRLRKLIDDLDSEATQCVHRHIPTDDERVKALIAGEDVAQRDKKDIEAAASKVRLIGAQRQQAVADLAGVDEALGRLIRDDTDLDLQRHLARIDFLEALAGALFEAYQQNIIEFIEKHIPPLLSVCAEVSGLTGKQLASHSNVWSGLRAVWPNLQDPVNSTGHPHQMYSQFTVWPRPDGTLVSGEPAWSPDIVEAMVAAIWAHPETAANAKHDGAAAAA